MIGWKRTNHSLPFKILTDTYKSVFYKSLSSFACWALKDNMFLLALSVILTLDICEDFNNSSTELEASFSSSIQPKQHQKQTLLKGQMLQISSPNTTAFARKHSSFPVFPINASFYNIFHVFVFISSC